MTTRDWHTFKVVSPFEHGKDSYVEMDGRRLNGVLSVQINVGVKEVNRVVLTMYAKSINAEVEAEEPVFAASVALHDAHIARGITYDGACYACNPVTAEEAGVDA